jgi:hypothetical protein
MPVQGADSEDAAVEHAYEADDPGAGARPCPQAPRSKAPRGFIWPIGPDTPWMKNLNLWLNFLSFSNVRRTREDKGIFKNSGITETVVTKKEVLPFIRPERIQLQINKGFSGIFVNLSKR